MPELEHPPQEPDALPGIRLALVGVGLVGVAAVLSLVAVLIVRHDLQDAPRPPAPGERPAALEASHLPTTLLLPPTEVSSPHRAQSERAARFGWVDREAGIVHIPLDLAMQLRLARARRDQRSSP